MKTNILIKALLLSTTLVIYPIISSNRSVIAGNENIEETLFKKIVSADGLNNLTKSKDDIKRVLKLNPKHVGANFYAGKYCYQTGNFENAEKFLKRIVNDATYGAKANNLLADIRLKNYNSRFMTTLKIHISGESFDKALQICEDALSDMPDNQELLFYASFASCMLGKKDKAESYAEIYSTRTDDQALAAELKTLVDAWFTESFDNDLAIEKFLSIKNKHLMTPLVKKRIKNILISSNSVSRYEDFIRNEIDIPGADRDSLERELITFLLEQNQFKKALELINKRPIDSIEDNILYIWALCGSDQQIKALNAASSLIAVAPRDLRVYKAWVEAWISYTNKNKSFPEGKDNQGKTYEETIERLFQLLRPDKLVTQEPELLIHMLRLASFIGNDVEAQKIQTEVAKIAFTDEHEKLLITTVDELVAFDRAKMAVAILESAVNQLPDNYNLSLKLSQTYLEVNPEASVRLCEEVMQQNPNLIRALLQWCDAMNVAGKTDEAINELVKRLSDDSLNDAVKRQLNAKLEQLRIQENPELANSSSSSNGSNASNDPNNPNLQNNPNNKPRSTGPTVISTYGRSRKNQKK